VRLRFAGEHQHRPTVLGGNDRFIIPIRALDQANPNGSASFVDPSGQLDQVFFTLTMISLNGDADVAPIAKLVLAENRPEDLRRQILVRMLLHIEVDENMPLPGNMKNRTQAIYDSPAGSSRIDRIKLAVER